MKIGIYNQSQLIAWIERPNAKAAWHKARKIVREMAFSDGVQTQTGWYYTRNRSCYESGIYRAMPIIANR